MASSRRGVSASAKNQLLLNQLDYIAALVDADHRNLNEAVALLSNIINHIYSTSFQQTVDWRRPLRPVELAKIEAVLCSLVDKFGRNSEKSKKGNPVVHFLEAKYVARRCHVEAALGLYRDIEKYYPTYGPAFAAHYDLLMNCGRDDEAARVAEQKNQNMMRSQLSKWQRAPGAIDLKDLVRLGTSFFSQKPALTHVVQQKAVASPSASADMTCKSMRLY